MTTINSNNSIKNATGVQSVEMQTSGGTQSTGGTSDTSFIQKTSENDLVEFVGNTNSSSTETGTNSTAAANTTTTVTINPTAASTIELLQIEQENYTQQLEQLNKRLENLQKRYKTAQTQLSRAKALGKDTSKLDEVANNISGTISEVNSKISQCISNLNNTSSKMTQAINNLYTVTTTSTPATTNTTATGATGVTDANTVNGTNATNSAGLSGYNVQKAQALADAAYELHGNNPYSGGMCGSGVTESIQKAFGVGIYGNGCDFRDLLRGRSDWVEVTDSFPTVESLDNLPAGAVVSWQPYNTTSAGNTYGHVYIADGKGNEISDFIGPMNNTRYANGGSWSVFLPA